jgi:hypothetical protein
MKSVRVAVQIDEAIAADLRRYARFHNVSANSVVSDAVQHVMYFAEHRMKHVMERDTAFQTRQSRGGSSTVLGTGKI